MEINILSLTVRMSTSDPPPPPPPPPPQPKSRHAIYCTHLCTHSVKPMKRVSKQRARNILPLTQWVLRWHSARQPWPCWWCWAGGSREQSAAGRHPDPSLTGSLGTGDKTNVIIYIYTLTNQHSASKEEDMSVQSNQRGILWLRKPQIQFKQQCWWQIWVC